MDAQEKAKLRSWLFRLLADLEVADKVHAEKTESGNTTTLIIIMA